MIQAYTPMGMFLSLAQAEEKSFIEIYVQEMVHGDAKGALPPVVGATVTAVVNGRYFTGRTAEKGRVRLEVPVPEGKSLLVYIEKPGYFGTARSFDTGRTYVTYLAKKPGALVVAGMTPMILVGLGSAALGAGLVYLFTKKK
jgi:hypothetical protein